MTRLAWGIVQPRKYTDGTIPYKSKHGFSVVFAREPQCLEKALEDPRWKEAMNIEFSALLKNGTWHFVPPG